MHRLRFLPSSSLELERELTRLGKLMIRTSISFKFNENVLDIGEGNVIDAIVIEFLNDIKNEFRALLALRENRGRKVEIEYQDISSDLLIHTVCQSKEMNVELKAGSFFFLLKKKYDLAVKNFRLRLYVKKNNIINLVTNKNSIVKDKVDVLFVSYYPNNISVLTPLVEEIERRNDLSFFYLATRLEAFRELKRRKIRHCGFIGNSQKKNRINKPNFDLFLKEIFEEIDATWSLNKYFCEKFKMKLIMRINQCLNWHNEFVLMLGKLKPKAIVFSTGSSPDSRLLIQMAQKRSIPDFVITHGLFQDTPSLVFQNMTWKFVWSQYQKDLINKYTNVKCIVSGSPKHDILLKKAENKFWKNSFDRPYILFPTTPPTNIIVDRAMYDDILRNLICVAERMPEFLFVVKLHPTENIDDVISFVKANKNGKSDILITKSHDIYNLLNYAELVFVVGSTVGFESILFNRKTVAYYFNKGERWYPFKDSNRFKYIDTFNGLDKLFTDMINDSSEFDEINDPAYYFEESNIPKMLDTILEK